MCCWIPKPQTALPKIPKPQSLNPKADSLASGPEVCYPKGPDTQTIGALWEPSRLEQLGVYNRIVLVEGFGVVVLGV